VKVSLVALSLTTHCPAYSCLHGYPPVLPAWQSSSQLYDSARAPSLPCTGQQGNPGRDFPADVQAFDQAYAAGKIQQEWRFQLAARCVAAVRLWPEMPRANTDAAACTAFVVSCLELGVKPATPQLLIQAAQALCRDDIRANMCALPQHIARRMICLHPLPPIAYSKTDGQTVARRMLRFSFA